MDVSRSQPGRHGGDVGIFPSPSRDHGLDITVPLPLPSAEVVGSPTAAPAPMAPAKAVPAQLRFPLVAVGEPVSGQVVVTPGANQYQL